MLEARARIGGRVHTVEVGGVRADAGGAWLQQRSANPLVAQAHDLRLHLVATDFGAPLSGAYDGEVGDIDAALARIVEAAHSVSTDRALARCSIVSSRPWTRPRGAQPARDRRRDRPRGGSGTRRRCRLSGHSARPAPVMETVDRRGLRRARGRCRSRRRHPTRDASRCDPLRRRPRHGRNRDKRDRRRSLHLHRPVSLLAAGVPSFHPPLPEPHRDALSRLGMGRRREGDPALR